MALIATKLNKRLQGLGIGASVRFDRLKQKDNGQAVVDDLYLSLHHQPSATVLWRLFPITLNVNFLGRDILNLRKLLLHIIWFRHIPCQPAVASN